MFSPQHFEQFRLGRKYYYYLNRFEEKPNYTNKFLWKDIHNKLIKEDPFERIDRITKILRKEYYR
jgi:hypothetical protein